MVIPEVRQERLYQKIANLIIKLINDNIFPPGTFLPPEREPALTFIGFESFTFYKHEDQQA